VGLGEHDNEPSGPKKKGKEFEQISDYQLVKKNCSPLRYFLLAAKLFAVSILLNKVSLSQL